VLQEVRMKVLTPEQIKALEDYRDYRYQLWDMLADKGAVLIESELDEIQHFIISNKEVINEVKNMS
jgi:hypothetical protein